LAKNQIFIAQGFKKYKNKKWVELLLKVKMNEKGKRFTLFFLEEKESSEMEPEAIEKERENVIKERQRRKKDREGVDVVVTNCCCVLIFCCCCCCCCSVFINTKT
jgi:hypothetical protein